MLVNKKNVVSTNGASEQRRLKPGKQFFVTISLPELYNNVRQDFVANFDDLATYCVAVETPSEKSTGSYHLHAFLEFNRKLLISDLRDYLDVLRDILFSNHLDVQPCRSKRNALKYILKEGKHLYFHCKVSDLNVYYRCLDWCSRVLFIVVLIRL